MLSDVMVIKENETPVPVLELRLPWATCLWNGHLQAKKKVGMD